MPRLDWQDRKTGNPALSAHWNDSPWLASTLDHSRHFPGTGLPRLSTSQLVLHACQDRGVDALTCQPLIPASRGCSNHCRISGWRAPNPRRSALREPCSPCSPLQPVTTHWGFVACCSSKEKQFGVSLPLMHTLRVSVLAAPAFFCVLRAGALLTRALSLISSSLRWLVVHSLHQYHQYRQQFHSFLS
ncbi:uncharacterized protein BP01DRAFT_87327 [Aspergillus saccharolyticus JOP 1030-1]|uniref:Uncharacterized protein n=1 Tax=Aspergillus saccharolyticus JOP 1030-1 TaxID=1450539 RepID=A0A318ZA66_9EURO|nr:hypothetical protein BP01DRAFT_87327 [Aspergillus saccharolyticus JOP 1030-1]PYH44325.1 hypothetical protein BP01DRAFT_87327 [Aspergillus saccharolyticus JOP 1030-1]